MTRPLGKTQKLFLESIVQHHSFYECCGWVWGNLSTTLNLLDSLAKRGLVKKFPPTKIQPYDVWRPTEAGIELDKKLSSLLYKILERNS